MPSRPLGAAFLRLLAERSQTTFRICRQNRNYLTVMVDMIKYEPVVVAVQNETRISQVNFGVGPSEH